MSCILTLLSLLFSATAIAKPDTIQQEIARLQDSNSPLLEYPSQFTQGIIPKAIHSHNDYWRDVPLLTALSFGVASVEADVWLINGELYVGHDMASLDKSRTFKSLYVQPLLDVLDKQNPKTEFTVNQSTKNGVFDTSTGTSLQLLVDIKTDGPSALPVILSALEPLRQNGYLTTFKDGQLSPGAVTVVGTGNTPLEGIKNLSPRDLFFDAPLANLTGGDTEWSVALSPLASTDYAAFIGWDGTTPIKDDQLARIQQMVNDAQNLGLKARFWDTPGWPINARNNIWKTLVGTGNYWLNADDLEAAANF
ncbi:hypothetical protein AMATHDRAFT_135231 [Amanita thiersii Skay4041]|uniref:Altered inheritance of mitochondria protein 6 n=1 Tax=Amanita thiersii Skay4041 TaxID=703135 RepID=A0A2A9P1M3_9AGAR|nr:hypothetical protein AMATHDRAFT_135231 [Amanita thiersii Skay4041]